MAQTYWLLVCIRSAELQLLIFFLLIFCLSFIYFASQPTTHTTHKVQRVHHGEKNWIFVMLQLIFGMCSKWLRRAELEFSHLLCIFLKKLFSIVLNSFVFSQLLNSLMMMDKSRPSRVVDTERHESSTNLIESDNLSCSIREKIYVKLKESSSPHQCCAMSVICCRLLGREKLNDCNQTTINFN